MYGDGKMSVRKFIDENVVLSGIGFPVVIMMSILLGVMIWMKLSGY